MNIGRIPRLFVAASAAICLGCGAASAENEEFRALWVDAWGVGFLDENQVADLVQDARDYNFNAIVVQMRRRADAFYMPQPPNQDPRTTVLASDFDALAEIIAEAQSGSPEIEVHCWLTTNLVWSDEQNPPSQSDHIYNQHPEYLMKDSGGDTHIGEGFYVDPGHPDAMKWTYNVAVDIVTNYDIDGLHWDYVRYPAQDSGYNDTAISRFNEEFGLSGQPNPDDPQFSEWRRRQVSDFLRWVNADLLEIDPDLQVSAATFANRTDAYTHRFQDWAAWMDDGIIDINMPMNYTSSNSIFESRVDDIYNHQGIRVAYVGQGAYLNDKEDTVTQLQYVRNKPMWGTVLYSYRVPNDGPVDRDGTFSYIRDNYQPTWEDTPDLPWKTNPDTGIVKGIVTSQETSEEVYNATVEIDAGPGFSQLSCVRGSYAFYDADDGTWTVSASAPGFGDAEESVTVVPGQVVTVNLELPEQEPGDPPDDIIIDNPQAVVAGSWITGTSATDKYGDDYYWKGQGDGSAYVQYTPQIEVAGDYHVYEWHPQGTNRTAFAPHEINHAQGTDTVYIDQQVDGGDWNFIGTYPFEAGSSGNVRITDDFSDNDVVMADAIAFVFDEAAEPPEVTDVHVENIDMAVVDGPGPWSYVSATIEIRDSDGALVDGATVEGDFTGAIEESGSGTTGPGGQVEIVTNDRARNGTVTFTVTDVFGDDMEYDAASNNQTSDSISF